MNKKLTDSEQIFINDQDVIKRHSFIASIRNFYIARDYITEKQYSVMKRIMDEEQSSKKYQMQAPNIYETIFNAVDKSNAKRPRVRLRFKNFEIKNSSNGRKVWIDTDLSNYYSVAVINEQREVVFNHRFQELDDDVKDTIFNDLKRIEGNPEGSAKSYGLDTGTCCCCGRTLTDPKSVLDGIGPICAGRFFGA